MAEERKEVKTYRVSYRCQKCPRGFLQYAGVSKAGGKNPHTHQCTTCGAQADLAQKYPKIVYKEIE